ncbi:putative ATP-dependent DNA helicase YjcD [Actinomadura rubteroloni]|uniref:DNA 3'-5' helicase n=1 Tax=Actinomadura rubteroloni TaxID=1926885 RepID=A0A2P4UM25_9ACTN|nr:UvrD-helicase domain-containing protein [Actinomadura rubteroloni]POM26100.1 putative ATP-dependent DNA helicase YjcD [Actinomadura rubteroloni]
MSVQDGATLRLLDKADKEIQKLPRTIKGAIYEFQHKFRKNPDAPGLRLKQLRGDSQLYSARVTDSYRALLLHAGNRDYILVAVKDRKDVYDNLDRYRYQINQVTGGIEFVDLSIVASTPVSPDVPKPSAPAPESARPAPLLAGFAEEQLRELGVAGPLIKLALKITTEEDLLALVEFAPALTEEVLLALHDGKTYDEVLEQVTRPVRTDDEIDPADYATALARPATKVTTEDTDLQSVLDGDFGRWKVFLHPTQRKIVERDYRGPARVSGGPGTGKTIVALHRVKHLVDRLPPGEDRPVLLTTFNKNLAADLRDRLLELGGPEILKRVDIVNIDKLATGIVSDTQAGGRRRWIDDERAVREWRELLLELDEDQWDPQFLHDEWSQVILGLGERSRTAYFRARRAGRGRNIGRAQRSQIWQLVEKFTMRLDEKNLWTYRQVAWEAARLELERASKIKAHAESPLNIHLADRSIARENYRYGHVVVDEAQDLNVAHWRMLRAMVPEGDNDMFIAGDTHQRIYGNYVTLGSLGINIRGRSSRLTLSYRTTHEILGSALGLLGDESWDDLDDGKDDLNGYRSVLRGPRPVFRAASTWPDELELIAEQVAEWAGTTAPSIAVCVPERSMVADVESRLGKAGIRAASIGPDGPKLDDAVHVGTMHRFKGLEYQHMVIAGISEGTVPRAFIQQYENADPVRHRRELQQARSLLFVAATRARDTLLITWHGRPSRFLPTDR